MSGLTKYVYLSSQLSITHSTFFKHRLFLFFRSSCRSYALNVGHNDTNKLQVLGPLWMLYTIYVCVFDLHNGYSSCETFSIMRHTIFCLKHKIWGKIIVQLIFPHKNRGALKWKYKKKKKNCCQLKLFFITQYSSPKL